MICMVVLERKETELGRLTMGDRFTYDHSLWVVYDDRSGQVGSYSVVRCLVTRMPVVYTNGELYGLGQSTKVNVKVVRE